MTVWADDVGNPLLRKGGSQTLRQIWLCLFADSAGRSSPPPTTRTAEAACGIRNLTSLSCLAVVLRRAVPEYFHLLFVINQTRIKKPGKQILALFRQHFKTSHLVWFH